MVDLFAAPFVELIDRMRLEFRNQEAIFDLPARRWWLPAADGGAPDLSVRFHDRVAGNAGRARLRAAVADGPEPRPLLARRRRGSWSSRRFRSTTS